MSVLIKGMEIPESCEKCPFLDYEEGFCFASGVKHESGWYESTLCPGSIKDGRHEDCPLVPVPPHGRLIDADAALKLLRNLGSRDYRREKGTIMDAMKMLSFDEYTPTIIPASDKDTNVLSKEEGET